MMYHLLCKAATGMSWRQQQAHTWLKSCILQQALKSLLAPAETDKVLPEIDVQGRHLPLGNAAICQPYTILAYALITNLGPQVLAVRASRC